MSMNVALVGSTDGQLAAMVRAGGHQVKETSLEKLLDAAGDSRSPDAVVADLRAQPSVPASLGTFKRQHADVGIIVVAATLDPNLMREAMRLGAAEYLADPVTATELEAALERVQANRTGPAAAQVFAFVGAKGGVGNTTVAVNVATTLAMLSPGQTLFLDLHVMGGDAAVFLGVEPKFSVVDALENSHRLDETFFRTLVMRSKSGVDLLASSEHVVATQFEPSRIRALVEFVGRFYRFVVLDVPRLHPGILDALDPAAAVVIVTSQEVSSVRSGARLWSMLSPRYGKEKVKAVLARPNALTEISQQDIERALGTGLRHQIPNNYEVAVRAVNAGRPLAMDNHTQLASTISALARELAGLAADRHPGERRAGLFGRLTGRRP